MCVDGGGQGTKCDRLNTLVTYLSTRNFYRSKVVRSPHGGDYGKFPSKVRTSYASIRPTSLHCAGAGSPTVKHTPIPIEQTISGMLEFVVSARMVVQ